MPVGGSHAKRTLPLWCHCLWNQGIFCRLFLPRFLSLSPTDLLRFLLLQIALITGLMFHTNSIIISAYIYIYRWFLGNMASLHNLTKAGTWRKGPPSFELIKSCNLLMRTSSTSLRLGRKRCFSSSNPARTMKSTSSPVHQLLWRTLPVLWLSMFVIIPSHPCVYMYIIYVEIRSLVV